MDVFYPLTVCSATGPVMCQIINHMNKTYTRVQYSNSMPTIMKPTQTGISSLLAASNSTAQHCKMKCSLPSSVTYSTTLKQIIDSGKLQRILTRMQMVHPVMMQYTHFTTLSVTPNAVQLHSTPTNAVQLHSTPIHVI